MAQRINRFLLFLIGLLGFKSNSAEAAVTMFLCDPGGELQGESQDPKHPGCIDVLAWSWGAFNTGTLHLGGGGGAGKAQLQDFSVTKWIDKSSPEILYRTFNGEVFPKLEFSVFKSCPAGPLPVLEITMEEVFTSSFGTGGSGGEDRLTENVSFNFSKINYCYSESTCDGKLAEKCSGWDINQNTDL